MIESGNSAILQAGACFHCGLEVPSGTHFNVAILGKNREMCCAGCAAVAEAIMDAGQEAFYAHRTDFAPQGNVLVPDFLTELEVYNNPEIQKSFVVAKDENLREASLLLEGITCAACVWLNEKHIASQVGVTSVQINYATHRAQVIWDSSRIQLSEILGAIRAIGYSAHPYDPNQQHSILQKERKTALRRIGVAGILGMQIMMLSVALYLGDWTGIEERFRTLFNWAGLIFVLPILFYSAKPFYSAAVRDLQNRRMGMDIPVALALSIAFVSSVHTTINGVGHVYYDSISMFVFLLSTARFFEFRSREHSADVNERLANGMPATAHRLCSEKNEFETVAVAELVPGDTVRIFAGEVVPADGEVTDGVSSVDESLLTGESLPRMCRQGDKLVGGSVNAESPLLMNVESVGQETVLSHMVRLMERAQTEKPAVAQLANRISGWFVLVILSIATTAGAGWYMAGSERWLEIVISLLVVTCPCALSMATPAAMTAATGALASIGMLVTRGNAIESLHKITDFSFDKTGTLTDGALKLQRFKNHSNFTDMDLIAMIASLESGSEHLLARALVKHARSLGVDFDDVDVVSRKNYPGQGVSGIVDGRKLFVGNIDFIRTYCQSAISTDELTKINADGFSVVMLSDEQRVLGVFWLGDQIRPGAQELIRFLEAKNIQSHLLTGDTVEAANRVAEKIEVSDVRARMSPADKLAAMKDMQEDGRIIAMLGDGINDSPVLAGAQVSIAMGSAAQLTKFNADIVLVSNSLRTLKKGLRHAGKTVVIVRENLAWALFYNLLAIPIAAMGYITPWMAAIGMSLSSLLVVLNSSRLRYIPDHSD